jgi:hypothetical protein
MDTIQFENKKFKIRQIQTKDGLKRIISSTELNNSLLTESGNYVSVEARKIDEQIYFFVDKPQLNLNNIELADYVNRACL